MDAGASEELRYRTPPGSEPVGPASPRIRFRQLNPHEDNKGVREPAKKLAPAHGRRMRGESKYTHLLEEDRGFNAWYCNVLRGSYNTGAWSNFS